MIRPSTNFIDPGPAVKTMLDGNVAMVTFDVFDTLLWRNTLFPHDAFLMFEGMHHRLVAQARQQAERVVTIICRRLLRREPTLRDIYRLLPFDMEQELTIENHICIANPYCLSLVEHLVERGIDVAAVSDMYMEAEQITEILRHTGYPAIPLYSSASEQSTKFDSGKLLFKVWQRHGAAPEGVIHVGDNLHADIAMAERHGARTCHVATPRETLFDLYPVMERPMQSAEETLFWGQLAIRLHTFAADDPVRLANARRAWPTLSEILKASSHPSIDRAWAEIEPILFPRTERSSGRCLPADSHS
jgi:predicted HAD superfamily hydrolase